MRRCGNLRAWGSDRDSCRSRSLQGRLIGNEQEEVEVLFCSRGAIDPEAITTVAERGLADVGFDASILLPGKVEAYVFGVVQWRQEFVGRGKDSDRAFFRLQGDGSILGLEQSLVCRPDHR